jgi:hypothetical protein
MGHAACSNRWADILSLCRGQSLFQTYIEYTTQTSSLPRLRNTSYQALYPLQISLLLLERALHTGKSQRFVSKKHEPDAMTPRFEGLADA